MVLQHGCLSFGQKFLSPPSSDCIELLDVFLVNFNIWKLFGEEHSEGELDPQKNIRWWAPSVSSVSFWDFGLRCNNYNDLKHSKWYPE